MTRLIVHQLLHGYRKGHQLLAGSVRLGGEATDLVARLSDLSGTLPPNTQLRPYLTTYPVTGSRYYAVATTRLDVDAPRSGCVLTHTLLVDEGDWARLRSPAVLRRFLDLEIEDEARFGSPLTIDPTANESAAPRSPLQLPGASEFVAKYFGEGNRPVAWFDCEEPEEVLWAVLTALWPSLRKRFAACTYCLQPRSTADGPFDLMFAPGPSYPRFRAVACEGVIRPSQPAVPAGASPREPWVDELSRLIFQSEAKSSVDDLAVFGPMLGEDPTSVRSLFLLRDLRSRLTNSPTAGVGLMDVLESVAPSRVDAAPYKQEVVGEAIRALDGVPAADALRCLFLIGERLAHPAFGSSANGAAPLLAAAVTARVPGHIVEAIANPCRSLAPPEGMQRAPYVEGLVRGLEMEAGTAPVSLLSLRQHPETAGLVVGLSPAVARGYLLGAKQAGPEALLPFVRWLGEVSEPEQRDRLREELLPDIDRDEEAPLAEQLLEGIPVGRVAWAMDLLSRSTSGFGPDMIRGVACEILAGRHPAEVRAWARDAENWSAGSAEVVAASFGDAPEGLDECASYLGIDGGRRSEVLAAYLERTGSGRFPSWLREYARASSAFLVPLLEPTGQLSARVERCVTRLLDEGLELPIARTPGLLATLDRLTMYGFFPRLAEQALRSAVKEFVAGANDLPSFAAWASTTWGLDWLERVPGGELCRLLRPECGDPSSWERAWAWLAWGPATIYTRAPAVLPSLVRALLPGPSDRMTDAACEAWVAVLRRAKGEADASTYLRLCLDAVGFAFAHTGIPLGAVVAEAFPAAYEAVATSGVGDFGFFRILHWDRAKELRKSLIEAFLSSDWRPGDLAIAAGGEPLLRKVFKRVRRRWKGEFYIDRMLEDLSFRDEPHAREASQLLRELCADPDFYEPWD